MFLCESILFNAVGIFLFVVCAWGALNEDKLVEWENEFVAKHETLQFINFLFKKCILRVK